MQLLLTIIAGFFRFWYDFLVGDAWEIAAGVVVILAGGACLVRNAVLPDAYVPLLLVALLMLLLVGSVVVESKRKAAKG